MLFKLFAWWEHNNLVYTALAPSSSSCPYTPQICSHSLVISHSLHLPLHCSCPHTHAPALVPLTPLHLRAHGNKGESKRTGVHKSWRVQGHKGAGCRTGGHKARRVQSRRVGEYKDGRVQGHKDGKVQG